MMPDRKVTECSFGIPTIGTTTGRVVREVALTLECGHEITYAAMPSNKPGKMREPEFWPCPLCDETDEEIGVVS